MFINTQMGGMNLGFPDVCLTPTPVGPVPIPYPNISLGLTAVPPTAALKVLVSCMPAHTMMTMGSISNGDNAGVSMGVASGMVMGPHRTLLPSFTLLMGGMPTSRMTSLTGQNGISLNAPGVSLVPSQFKSLCLKP